LPTPASTCGNITEHRSTQFVQDDANLSDPIKSIDDSFLGLEKLVDDELSSLAKLRLDSRGISHFLSQPLMHTVVETLQQ